jgi:aryl-alcohol dehydrogenase-like predicted oxidoreductase/enamine deaminase RidA (YjgF/YER057c/UK114 family)
MPSRRKLATESCGASAGLHGLLGKLEAKGPLMQRITLPAGLEISRIVTGLWQVADQERQTGPLDVARAAAALADYAAAGFFTFDMADHYGSAEIIVGRSLQLTAARGIKNRPIVMTKWCPEPGPMTADVTREAVTRSLERLGVEQIDLMQLHWWDFQNPGYLDAMNELDTLQREGKIRFIGVTNFDTDHLRVLVKNGFSIASNQVSFSILDQRAAGEMAKFCLAEGIGLFAYGTLAGGLLSERWMGQPEQAAADVDDWSKMKYKRFVEAVGGWRVLQKILTALHLTAQKHGVSIANVATRWVLEQPAVAAVIIGARLGEREHRNDNLGIFSFFLDSEDRAAFEAACAGSRPIPGDCGDEYRRPPYLTASGDLSHHLKTPATVFAPETVEGRRDRQRIDTGSVWESLCGYSRAVRVGERIMVSGTTATHGSGDVVCRGDVHGQTVYILDKISASISALGGTLDDVVRTRIYLKDARQWEAAARVHGRYFAQVRPANTLVEVGHLVGDYEVEIEAEAIVGR